jgi:hypothetical protein
MKDGSELLAALHKNVAAGENRISLVQVDLDLEIAAFPSRQGFPEEGEAERGTLCRRHWDVHELKADPCRCGTRIMSLLPLVAGPAQPEGSTRLNAKNPSRTHCPELSIALPNLQRS